MKKSELESLKYVTGVNLVAIFSVALALVAVSVASLFQTITAFSAMADKSIPYLGAFLPIFYGVLFQYGQNAALYTRRYYCDKKILFRFLYWRVTSSDIAMSVFIVCAFVDGVTNVLWFVRTVEPSADMFSYILVRAIGYPTMILIVFVEESLGYALQALRRVINEYKSISERERASAMIEQARMR